MKKTTILVVAALAAGVAVAAPKSKKVTMGPQPATTATASDGLMGKVSIEQYPRLSSSCRLNAPSLEGASSIGRVYTKTREWIVLEAKYRTSAKTIDRLTFTWHVVLDTKSSTNKDKEIRAKIPPYSYFTQSTTYMNIPQGSHAASVCLHPSYLETFGEPVAVALLVTDQDGNILAGDTVTTQAQFFKQGKGHKFWEDPKIMDAKQSNGEPMVAQRQGLQDRSKTIWALVNPNDYEMVAQ